MSVIVKNNNIPKGNSEQQIKPYKKSFEYSYTLGAFPTYELILNRPDIVRKVLVHTGYTDYENLSNICNKNNIILEFNNKTIAKISDKENCYVAGVFNKYEEELNEDKPHIVLVNPSNMGNLGTILRTALGFGIKDIAIIEPCADVFNPKTVRSSMGAIFKLSHHIYKSFDDYRAKYPSHDIFTFMLNGSKTLNINDCPEVEKFALVFGNEASGLDDSFLDIGTSIFIPQSPEVDSLNLTIAVGIGTYMFTNKRKM
ncbi:MAG: TrmH family RNA methyltransferase [Clostridiales bacterium]|nr:TrmH family RNA methyltransferase [Clostridiales bacterium]